MTPKERVAKEAISLLEAFQEIVDLEHNEICYSWLKERIDGYKEYYSKDGDFW